jgi:hypothetical protein
LSIFKLVGKETILGRTAGGCIGFKLS